MYISLLLGYSSVVPSAALRLFNPEFFLLKFVTLLSFTRSRTILDLKVFPQAQAASRISVPEYLNTVRWYCMLFTPPSKAEISA